MNLLVSDYDNTFYLNDEDFKKNIKASEKFMKDNIFVIATGRTYDRFKITNVACNYAILDHGASILKDDEIIYKVELNNKLKDEIVEVLKKKNIVYSLASSGYKSSLSLKDNNLTKIYVRYESVLDASYIKKLLLNEFKDKINVFQVFSNKAIEIVAKEASKYKAVYKISKLECIDKSDIYTIGDSYTDIDMVKNFNGYCIKNSIDEVKKYAKDEYSSVSNLIEDILTKKV